MNTRPVSLGFLLAGALAVSLALSNSLSAADAKSKPADPSKDGGAEVHKPKRDWYPFAGYVASVDKQARTVSLKKKDGERVLKTDAKSEIEVGGKPGTLADIKPGNYAHGKLHKDASGAEVITAAKFDKEGPARPPAGTDKSASDAKPKK
jgi:hypothetical protein